MVSSGAYQLVEHVVNGKIIVKKNPYYYAAAEVAIPQVPVSFHIANEIQHLMPTKRRFDMTFSLPTNDTQRLISEYPNKEVNELIMKHWFIMILTCSYQCLKMGTAKH